MIWCNSKFHTEQVSVNTSFVRSQQWLWAAKNAGGRGECPHCVAWEKKVRVPGVTLTKHQTLRHIMLAYIPAAVHTTVA